MYTYRSKQQIIVAIGLAVIALLGLFPPAISSIDVLAGNEVRPGYSEPAGRAFLWAPSKPVMTEKTLVVTRSIDYNRSVIEWIVVATFTAVALGILSIYEDRKRLAPPSTGYTEPRAA